jgi:hypothetical protein
VSEPLARPGTPEWDTLVERLRAKTMSLPVPQPTPQERQAIRVGLAAQMRRLGATEQEIHRFLHGPPPRLLSRLGIAAGSVDTG